MTRMELLTILYSLRKLLEKGLTEDALQVINQVIAEAERA